MNDVMAIFGSLMAVVAAGAFAVASAPALSGPGAPVLPLKRRTPCWHPREIGGWHCRPGSPQMPRSWLNVVGPYGGLDRLEQGGFQ